MKKGTFAMLRNKLREAEERGFNTALDMISQFTQHRVDDIDNSPHIGPVAKQKAAGPFRQILHKIHDLRTEI